MSFLYACIFALLISLTIAFQLDGVCNNDTQCDGGSKTHCQNQTCQCYTPWYKPCKLTCEINRDFAYQGEECREEDNCIGNTICRANKCECMVGYTLKNGVCFKNLTEVCGNDTDCSSGYCLNLRCACAPDHELVDNATNCRRKLVNVYNTWDEANATNEFCVNKNSCLDILADCYNDTRRPTKFCKCPIGFKVNADKQCEAIKGQLLSPLDSNSSSYGECGYCEDNNAACINAGKQRTCWCRAGYNKIGNQCVKQNTKPLIIFPNSNDLQSHDFTNDCNNERNNMINNKLCVCSPGYKFIAKDVPCEKIERDWIDDIYEYGLCTRINSRDIAISEDGQCPEPLKCVAREDKHVCSCGTDQFLDPNNRTQCVYKIGTKTNSINDTCPKYSERNSTSGICECLPGYKATVDNHQCEITLSPTVFESSSCNSNRLNDKICQDKFGKKASLCNVGECRCSEIQSYPNDEKTQCYAPVNTVLVTPMENCPPNSKPTPSDRCECDSGYRPSSDSHQCDRLGVQLIEYAGSSTITNNPLTTADCQRLFTGPVESYDDTRCQCKTDAFINDNKNGCWYKLDVTLTEPEQTLSCPPNSTTESGQQCKCDPGFTANNNKCVQITDKVFIDQDPMAKNVTGLTEYGCIKWFGQGAKKSTNGDYCICRPDAYRVQSDTYCHFLINISNTLPKRSQDCPDYTIISPETVPSACVCKPGYNISSDNRTCVTSSIVLNGSIDMEVSNTTNCINFKNDDCIAKYGKQAFCKDDKCYCNRQLSFINTDGKCESFSNYVYPGEHEFSLYTCNTNDDCGDKETVICDYFNINSGYKVCKCRDGALLDPKTQKCMTNRCINCNEALNFECHGYQCTCKNGYYLNGASCIKSSRTLELYRSCNATILREIIASNSIDCDLNCERAKCSRGYRPEKSNCVRYQLEKDKCIHQESICSDIDQNSICNTNENQCFCGPSYYSSNNTCARAVGSSCKNAEECGFNMICKGQRCACNDGQHEEEIKDVFGRLIKRCVMNDNNNNNNNGIDQIRFNPVLLLLFILVQVFFI